MDRERDLLPLDIRILGPVLLYFPVYSYQVASDTEDNRCALPDSGSLDRPGMVPNRSIIAYNYFNSCPVPHKCYLTGSAFLLGVLSFAGQILIAAGNLKHNDFSK